MTKYANHPRVLDPKLNPPDGQWGHRKHYVCDDCEHLFDDVDLFINRHGFAYCPNCHSEDFDRNDSQQIFKATKRRKIPKPIRPHLEFAA